jgi:predicted cupin superfamily sugar epimerase
MNQLSAADVKRILGLQPHPREGGWYIRSYEAKEHVAAEAFADRRYVTPRRTGTAIYYLLEPDTFSEMHMLASDEIFHHYMGVPVEMLQLHADGSSSRHVIGNDLAAGQRPQLAVARGVWQGSRLLPGSDGPGTFALLGCTVSPGFEFDDYTTLPRTELIARWPNETELITQLTNF